MLLKARKDCQVLAGKSAHLEANVSLSPRPRLPHSWATDRGRACKEDHPSPLRVSAGSGLWLECQYSQLQGVREMGIALDRKLNPLHCTSASPSPRSSLSLPPPPHSLSQDTVGGGSPS